MQIEDRILDNSQQKRSSSQVRQNHHPYKTLTQLLHETPKNIKEARKQYDKVPEICRGIRTLPTHLLPQL